MVFDAAEDGLEQVLVFVECGGRGLEVCRDLILPAEAGAHVREKDADHDVLHKRGAPNSLQGLELKALPEVVEMRKRPPHRHSDAGDARVEVELFLAEVLEGVEGADKILLAPVVGRVPDSRPAPTVTVIRLPALSDEIEVVGNARFGPERRVLLLATLWWCGRQVGS